MLPPRTSLTFGRPERNILFEGLEGSPRTPQKPPLQAGTDPQGPKTKSLGHPEQFLDPSRSNNIHKKWSHDQVRIARSGDFAGAETIVARSLPPENLQLGGSPPTSESWRRGEIMAGSPPRVTALEPTVPVVGGGEMRVGSPPRVTFLEPTAPVDIQTPQTTAPKDT
jgi:hypothetical protein